jgi:hypothetical protein
MFVRATERRLSLRVSAAHPVKVLDEDERLLTSGRTANTSENGLMAVVRSCPLPPEVLIEITLPSPALSHRGRGQTRTVRYRARVVRLQIMGNLTGLGVQLLKKVE